MGMSQEDRARQIKMAEDISEIRTKVAVLPDMERRLRRAERAIALAKGATGVVVLGVGVATAWAKGVIGLD